MDGITMHLSLVAKTPITLCCRKQPKTFAFDHCFYSCDPGGENFASQEVVFNSLGRDILDNAFKGYNACIFAYGQTGKLASHFHICWIIAITSLIPKQNESGKKRLFFF